MNILVIEDDESMRELLKTALELDGHAVDTASNGREGWNKLTTLPQRPGLILLDHMMPEMDGQEFSEILMENEEFRSIPVVSLSGLDAPATPGLSLKKPFQLEDLTAVVSHFSASD